MTDITDHDRRAARAWAKNWQGDQDDDTSAAARVILATVDAPATTLAERLQYRADLLDNGDPDGDTPQALRDLATDAAQMEHDLTEARAEGERLTAVAEDYARRATAALTERDEARAEVDRLTAERDEKEVLDAIDAHYTTTYATHPDPADVEPGEAWLIRAKGREALAIRDGDPFWPWSATYLNGGIDDVTDESVTLITRLVPAPRVITNPGELEQLATRAVILSADDKNPDVYQRDSYDEWLDITAQGYSSSQVIRMERSVTVLYQPEEDQE